MKIYLVGGAVRDKLLGYPSDENDWVVVGASPKQMLDLKYTPVGKDFPVFLHPKTHEEYALARIERKTGQGYKGFACDVSTTVTLEEDLSRRDLTINAIAESDEGELTDPFNGRSDIDKRLLRHVSPAFSEDPVRILRLARFAARYHHLGFTIAEETQTLITNMVANGEASHLVPERVWKEFSRALSERSPEVFITTLQSCGALKVIFPQLDALFTIANPNGDSSNTDNSNTLGQLALQYLQQACQTSEQVHIRCACLIFAISLTDTKKSADVKALCEALRVPNEVSELSILLAQHADTILRTTTLNPEEVLNLLQRVDAFRRAPRFEDLLLCCEALTKELTSPLTTEPSQAKQSQLLLQCLQAALAVDVQSLVASGLKGAEIGKALFGKRIDIITEQIKALTGN
ncbi:MAG: multifunctional CCA addition/repair protein [Alteromonadaceae bacterium]|nr:MAG: multifunctional CCA addition/repair protein [Alteromonadaceae bacterium]